MTDILIIEDNEEIGNLLKDFLEAEGYLAALIENGEEGVQYFKEMGAKLVVLDIMLPGIDGFAVCQQIRQNSNAPIIIISAKIEKEDKLNGLLLGADDYIEKPYDIDLLIAKIKGIFKRRYDSEVLICGDLKLDKGRHLVYRDGKEISLPGKEFELLQLFMENSGKVMSKELLFSKIWGYDSFSELQTLTVHIRWLREKIEKDFKNPMHIQTVWGVGYRFEE